MSTSSKNDEPLDRSNKGVPITSRRKLDDEICIPIEGRPAPKCDSVENHIQNHLKSIALLVIKKILYLSGPAWKYFKPRLERHEPELNEKYETRRQKIGGTVRTENFGRHLTSRVNHPKATDGFRRDKSKTPTMTMIQRSDRAHLLHQRPPLRLSFKCGPASTGFDNHNLLLT